MSTSVSTIEKLSEAIAAAAHPSDEQQRRIVVATLDLLAQGEPLSAAQIAARSKLPDGVVVAALSSWPGIFRDSEGRVVGFWGLAIAEMDHKFQADGGKPIYAWCALDPFLIVPTIGREARVESKDPITGDAISMTVTPEGIKDLSPATTVVSFIAPTGPFDFDVIESFCHFVRYFASRESGERWGANQQGVFLLPAAEAFEVGLRAWSQWRSPNSSNLRARAQDEA